jgi:hypothetical protein|nr:MAG TPA: hypothetical protein [Caudoviricetes sp.]
MSDLNLDNIVGFKAVDKDGNEQNVTVDEMVDMVSTRMVMALSETSTFAAVAATGNDVYENELPTVTDAANVRVLQSSGDAAQMTMQSLASKLGELIGTATREKTGLSDSIQALNSTFYSISSGSKNATLFKVCDYGKNILHRLYIYSAPNGTSDTCRYIRVILSDNNIFANMLLAKGGSNIRLFKDETSFYVYTYNGTWSRSNIEVFANEPHRFYFTDVTDQISISDLEEISIS